MELPRRYEPEGEDLIELPKPELVKGMSLNETISLRRSVREYASRSITLAQVGQLFWAAGGITSEEDRRSVPSAGAQYPLTLYLVSGKVDDLVAGVYGYAFEDHTLHRILPGDRRRELSGSALWQDSVAKSAISIVIASDYSRMKHKYKEKANRYIDIEVGHVGQNIQLQAVALGLASVPIGAFNEKQVKGLLNIDQNPLYFLSIGYQEA